MPHRHGLFRWEMGSPEPPHSTFPCFLVGIQQFFYGNLSFLKNSNDSLRLTAITMHFNGVLDRLLHSLDMLQCCMSEYADFYEQGGVGEGRSFRGTDLNACIYAESIYSYFNMLTDDLARLVPLIFAKDGVIVQEFSGGTKSGLLQQKRHFPEIEPLLNIDNEHSWWHLAFKREKGVRQRIIHYPDLVWFSGTQRQGESVKMEAHISNPERRSTIDYFVTLRRILTNFCNWLDGFEDVLIQKVQSRSIAEGFVWAPLEICPKVHLPVEKLVATSRKIPDQDFLYLPVCEGSSSIKCTVQYRSGGSSQRTV